MNKEYVIKLLNETISSNHSGDIDGIEEVADAILAKQKDMKDALDSIMRWGEQNGGHWCRETARSALKENK